MDGKAIFGDSIKQISDNQEVLFKDNVWCNKLRELTPFKYEETDEPKKDRYLFQGVA